MKAYRRTRGIVSLILNLRSQRRSGRFGDEKNLLCLPGLEPRTLRSVAYTVYSVPNPKQTHGRFESVLQLLWQRNFVEKELK